MIKHKIFNRFTALLLAAAFMYSFTVPDIPASFMITAYAGYHDTFTDDNFMLYEENNDGTLTLIGCETELTSSELTVPGEVEGKKVTAIGHQAFYNTGLTNVTLPEGLETIGEEAFSRCYSLSEINFPSTLKTIGKMAFNFNTELKLPDLPEGLETIGEEAFYLVPADTVTVPSSIKSAYKAFYHSHIASVSVESGAALDNYMFGDCSQLKSVVIGEGAQTLPSGLFMDCESLTEVSIPSTVTLTEQNAFCGCKSLTSVTLPEKLEKINTLSFQNCTALEKIHIPAGVTKIDRGAFTGCSSIKEYTVDAKNENYSSIGGALVQAEGKILLCVPAAEGEYTVPDVIEEISESAFSGKNKITGVKMSGVKRIGGYAFKGCTSLTEISLPDTLESIGYNAFDGTLIETIAIPKSLTSLPNDVFSGMAELEEINVDAGNESFYSDNGVLYGDEYSYTTYEYEPTLLKYPPKKADASYSVKEGTRVIGPSAFKRSAVKEIILPKGLNEIESYAFYEAAALESVTLPEGLKKIGSGAFICSGLKTVSLPRSITNIPSSLFYGCASLESITVPAGVSEIAGDAFSGCAALTVSGYDGSYIQSYASENQIPFNSLGEIPIVKVRAETEEEFLGALTSYTEITLADGIYVFETGSAYNTSPVTINNMKKITIKAENPGKSEILSDDGVTPVIRITGSSDITLDGLILGHKAVWYQTGGCGESGSGEYYSSGYVVEAKNSENISVTGCDLYGCGTVAVSLSGTKGFSADGCILRDCTENITDITACSGDISFKNCVISGCAYEKQYADTKPAVKTGSNAENCNITFDGCTFINNFSNQFTNDTNAVKTTNCIFSDNVWDNQTPKTYGVCLNGITWEITEKDNRYILGIGNTITLADGGTLKSGCGGVLPYSSYSVPWKKYYYDEYVCAGEVNFNPNDITDPYNPPAQIIAETSITKAEYDEQSDETDIIFSISGSKKRNAVIYAGLYDENGCLLSVGTERYTLNSGSKADMLISIPTDGSDRAAEVRLFVFAENDSVSPLANMSRAKIGK